MQTSQKDTRPFHLFPASFDVVDVRASVLALLPNLFVQLLPKSDVLLHVSLIKSHMVARAHPFGFKAVLIPDGGVVVDPP